MSVIPTSVRLPDGTRPFGKPRDPPGTANIPYGYRLSQRGQTRRTNVNVENVKQSRRNVNAENVKQSPRNVNGENIKSSARYVNPSDVKHSRGDGRNSVKEAHDSQPDAPMRGGDRPRRKDQPIAILPVDPSTWNLEDNAREKREYNSFMRTQAFVERTDRRILRKHIAHLVDEGIEAYEEDIEARREKLRRMIQAEEEALTREIIDQAQRSANWQIDATRKRTEELRERIEKQRQATVAEKRMQQYLTQCPEARETFTRKTTIETKYSNLVQIAENDAKRQAEREVDGLWYELMLKDVEVKRTREVEEERRRAVTGRAAVATLGRQIAGKLALSEEEKRVKEEERDHLARLLESVRQEESSRREIERSKKAKLRKDLEEQLLVAKRCLVERAREEAIAERTFRMLGEAELEREKTALRESSARLRGEILAYMRSLEELREEEARRDAEIEAMVEAEARAAKAKLDLARLETRESRARALREVLEGREQQLRRKRAADEVENKRAAAEGELRRKESEVEASLTAEAAVQRRESAQRYGQELKAQREYAEAARRREHEENERIRRAGLKREREYQKLTEQLLNAPEIITPHAFKILLKECAARREAEQKGLCYCPLSRAPQPRPSDHP